jgi:hypothetical protein
MLFVNLPNELFLHVAFYLEAKELLANRPLNALLTPVFGDTGAALGSALQPSRSYRNFCAVRLVDPIDEYTGKTPLHLVSCTILRPRRLLANGANPNARTKQFIPRILTFYACPLPIIRRTGGCEIFHIGCHQDDPATDNPWCGS